MNDKHPKTSTEVKSRYNRKTYDVLSFRVPKAMADAFKEKCSSQGISQAKVIKNAIEKFLQE